MGSSSTPVHMYGYECVPLPVVQQCTIGEEGCVMSSRCMKTWIDRQSRCTYSCTWIQLVCFLRSSERVCRGRKEGISSEYIAEPSLGASSSSQVFNLCWGLAGHRLDEKKGGKSEDFGRKFRSRKMSRYFAVYYVAQGGRRDILKDGKSGLVIKKGFGLFWGSGEKSVFLLVLGQEKKVGGKYFLFRLTI